MQGRTKLAIGVTAGLIGVAGAVWGWSAFVLQRTYTLDVREPQTVAHVLDVERGEHLLVDVLACGTCHGADLGGAWMEPLPRLGKLWAPNLTTRHRTKGDEDRVRDATLALRHGVGHDGRALLGMPTARWSVLTDADLIDLQAAIDRRPLVDRADPERTVGVGAALAVAMGEGVNVQTDDMAQPASSYGPTASYGAYVAQIAGCEGCHGGTEPLPAGVPTPEPLASMADWTGAAFARAVREGVGLDGRALHPVMPSEAFAGLDDTELDSLWLWVRGPSDKQDSDGTVSIRAKP